VNLIRAFPGQGIIVWGARTASSDSLWRYVNVRRLFIYVEESIKANTNWVAFEPNDETLWIRVEHTIKVFLTGLWREGALAGASSDEAFYVQAGRDTMSQDDIESGRLICVIGIAPVKPAEFVIFRIEQKTAT
jgi:phage tail sheath protein FI